MPVKIISINANGLNHPAKRYALWKEAKTSNADIISVQETHFQTSNYPKCSNKNFPYIYLATSPTKKRGILVAIKNTVDWQVKDTVIDPEGRYVIITGTLNNMPITLASIYTPNTHQLRFLKRTLKVISRIKYGDLMICGDFNLTTNPELDTSSPPTKRKVSLHGLFHKENLYDVWRCLHASERDYTFYSSRHRTYSRLDMFVSDWHLLGKISSAVIKDITWSDHAVVEVTIDEGIPRGANPVWRCNTRNLQLDDCKKHISQHLTEYFDKNANSVSDPWCIWGAHKAYMRGICIQLNSKIKKQYNLKLSQILAQIHDLETRNKIKPDPKTTDDLTNLRTELRSALMEQNDIQFRRLKLHCYAHFNKTGKALANRLKTRQTKSRISSLRQARTNDKITHPQDIANEFAEYYHSLYNLHTDPTTFQPLNTDITNFLDNLNLPRLTNSQLESLNQPISIDEIRKTILSLPQGKSPGPDGFPSEYYKLFHQTLSPFLLETFNKAIRTSSFPKEMLGAYVTTIPKQGKDPLLPESYRPISLLNTDLKIFAKLLAKRLQKMIPLLVQQDQLGFIPGRQTSDATRRIVNIVNMAEKR